ncbi:MAG: TldD/PmbA family protein [Clostridia bacterium]|nr:TldD/PmbA family protein [Clostridia bacterium]
MNYELLKKAIEDEAARLGLTEYEIYYMSNEELSVDTLNKVQNSFSSGVSGGICFRVLHDGKMGYAASELMEEAEMKALVSRAMANAEATDKLDTVGIFAGSPSYAELKNQGFTPKSAAELKSLTSALAEEIYGASDKVTGGTATYGVTAGFTVRLSNSHGLNLETRCGISALQAAAVISDDGKYESAYDMKELKGEDIDMKAMAEDVVADAIRKASAGLIESGKYSVVLSAKQMRTILSAYVSAFSAKTAQMGMSLLAGKEGEKIASDIVNITDDPMREGVSIQTNFDAEGVAAYRKSIVEGGVLKTMLHNRETAKKAGVESTGNASKGGYASPVAVSPYAFCLEAGDKTEDELFAMADGGIYITELKGLHAGANPITGDFSIESAGFRIVDGKPSEAVKSFTIAGNFFELLKSIAALSDTVEVAVTGGFTTFGSPAVLIHNMSVAGK